MTIREPSPSDDTATRAKPAADQKATADQMQARLDVAEQIFALFRPERFVHLLLNAVTFVVLIYAACLTIGQGGADKADLGLICGSGGLIGLTSTRLLAMYTEINRRVFE
jgi:hypothetical protein